MVPEDAAEAENVRSMVSEEGERPDNYQFFFSTNKEKVL